MDWIEYGIYGVCLVGSGYMSYDIGFRMGVSDCLKHLEDEGYITLEKEEDDHYIVKTSVHDNGIGIDVMEQGDLFKPLAIRFIISRKDRFSENTKKRSLEIELSASLIAI